MYNLRFQKNIYLLIIICVYISQNKIRQVSKNKKRIGVISLPNGQNVGNILVKFAMFNKNLKIMYIKKIWVKCNYNNSKTLSNNESRFIFYS